MNTWHVGGLELSSPVILGAGVCKTPFAAIPYQHPDLPHSVTVVGSSTPEHRDGNKPHPLSAWIPERNSGANSYGMPNDGYQVVYRQLRELWDAGELGTRQIVKSIAGFSPEDYRTGQECFDAAPFVAAIEHNLGCPNAHDKKIVPMSNDLASLAPTLALLAAAAPQKPVWLKLSPPITPEDLEYLRDHKIIVDAVQVVAEDHLEKLAALIARHWHFVRAVVATNTIGNCVYLGEDGRPITGPNGGKAGLSGELLRPIALRTARQLRELLPRSIDVIGQGGVLTGDHGVEYLKNDCAAFAVTSLPYFHGGAKALLTLLESAALQELLSNH